MGKRTEEHYFDRLDEAVAAAAKKKASANAMYEEVYLSVITLVPTTEGDKFHFQSETYYG